MKKVKLHWGWSILLVYITFMSVFLFYFWRSFQELKTNELVTKNYYEKEFVFGEVLDKRQNADTMRIQIQIIQDTDGLRIKFPPYVKDVKGKIILYKPDNSKFDTEININLNEINEQKIPEKKLIPGRWDLKLDWESNNIHYLFEQKLNLK